LPTEFRYFIPTTEYTSTTHEEPSRNSLGPLSEKVEKDLLQGLREIVLSPSSIIAQTTSIQSNYILYGNISSGTSSRGNRIIVKDLTEVSPYSLLLFGGRCDGAEIEVNYLQGLIIIDNYIRFSSPGRILAIVQSIRRALNHILEKKISNPSYRICEQSSELISSIVTLLTTDGIL